MASIFTAAGASLAIGTTAANATTDTYVTLSNVTDIPEFGRTYNVVKVQPLGTRGVQKIKGSYDEADLSVKMARDISDPGQAAALAARDVDADYNFKVTLNDAAPVVSATVTMPLASPGVVTWTSHGLAAGTGVQFSGGTLPTGITAATTYYVLAAGLTANTFEVSATPGGAAINFTGAGSGTITGTTVPVATTITFKAKVTSFTLGVSTIDNPIMATMALALKSGSSVETTHLP